MRAIYPYACTSLSLHITKTIISHVTANFIAYVCIQIYMSQYLSYFVIV